MGVGIVGKGEKGNRKVKGDAVKRVDIVVELTELEVQVELAVAIAMRIKVGVEIAIAVGIHDLISTQQLCRQQGKQQGSRLAMLWTGNWE